MSFEQGQAQHAFTLRVWHAKVVVQLSMCCGLSSGVHRTVRRWRWRLADAAACGASSSCSCTVASMAPVTTRLQRHCAALACCTIHLITGHGKAHSVTVEQRPAFH